MPNSIDSPALFLCAGKDCARKQRSAFDHLRSSAKAAGLACSMVRCQGSCKGPTAVVPTDDGLRWFEDLDSPKVRTTLVSFAAGDAKPTKQLVKRELTGKQKKKAAKKFAKQMS